MPNHLVLRPLCLVGSLAVVFFIASERPGNARPNYKNAGIPSTKDKLKANLRVTCLVCHSGPDMKTLNHYGKAIAEELGEKMVKDEAKIIAAIKAVAKRKCKSGEWGERLDKGLPPCDCGEANAGSYIARQLARDKH